jgi:hypothetical protein
MRNGMTAITATGIAIKSDTILNAQPRSVRLHGEGLDVLPGLLQRFTREPATHIPTSQLLRAMLADAAPRRLNLTWLLDRLRQRSFGAILLLLGFVAMLPGVNIVAGIALLAFGFQMMMGRSVPVLPAFIADHPLPAGRAMRLMGRALPAITALERIVKPRWPMPFLLTQRLVGFVVLLLAATLFLPVPLSNVIPGALTMMVALAYLEEDGILLGIALGLSAGSLAVTAVEAWAVIKGANFLLHL